MRTRLAPRLLDWFDRHGRSHLPWQQDPSPYRVWVSEIMLQQTQVATVAGYFDRFMNRFPDLPALANAELDDVLAEWSGLGYYARARNLHSAARHCHAVFGGQLPSQFDDLLSLPGIGRSTAGAVLALSQGQRHAILDGNVKRVLARYHAVSGWPGKTAVGRELWQLAERHTPNQRVADYTQAIMDLGATVCTSRDPDCPACPLKADCCARKLDKVSEFPQRKPRRPIPERSAVMLVALDASQRILLQRRPASGIWGGLWSLPQFESLSAADGWMNGRPDCAAEAILHSFTHFRLRATPWRYHVDERMVADSADLSWFGCSEIERLGLPQPVRAWTGKLFKEDILWQDK